MRAIDTCTHMHVQSKRDTQNLFAMFGANTRFVDPRTLMYHMCVQRQYVPTSADTWSELSHTTNVIPEENRNWFQGFRSIPPRNHPLIFGEVAHSVCVCIFIRSVCVCIVSLVVNLCLLLKWYEWHCYVHQRICHDEMLNGDMSSDRKSSVCVFTVHFYVSWLHGSSIRMEITKLSWVPRLAVSPPRFVLVESWQLVSAK